MGLYQTFQKQGGFGLVRSWLRNGVLPYAIGQVLLGGFSNKNLELLRCGIELKLYKKIRKKYLSVLSHFVAPISNESENITSCNKIWVCWMQGIENAPVLVQKCYHSLQENLHDREIVLITSENISEYTDFPPYIIEKYKKGIITHTHFSDLLRVELLCRYGGTWIDSTVFCSGDNIPSYMLDSDFFLFQNLKPGSDGSTINISSWFITAQANHKFMLAVRELLWAYWKKNDKLIDYFLLHHFIMMVAEYYSEDWEKIIPYSNSIPHILLLRLFEPYNKDVWDELKRICPFHKLAYKRSKEEFEKESTYYDVIFNGKLSNEQTTSFEKREL